MTGAGRLDALIDELLGPQPEAWPCSTWVVARGLLRGALSGVPRRSESKSLLDGEIRCGAMESTWNSAHSRNGTRLSRTFDRVPLRRKPGIGFDPPLATSKAASLLRPGAGCA